MTTIQTRRKKLVQREWRPQAKKLRKVVTQLRIEQLARLLNLKS